MTGPFPLPPHQPAADRQWSGWPWVAAGMAALALVMLIAVVAGTSARETASAAQPEPLVAETVTSVVTKTKTETVTVTSEVTVTPPPPPGPAVEFTEGALEVGVDVQPGKYKSAGPAGGLCYWARKSNDGTKIIDNGIVEGPGTITIRAGELIETTGCQTWVKAG